MMIEEPRRHQHPKGQSNNKLKRHFHFHFHQDHTQRFGNPLLYIDLSSYLWSFFLFIGCVFVQGSV